MFKRSGERVMLGLGGRQRRAGARHLALGRVAALGGLCPAFLRGDPILLSFLEGSGGRLSLCDRAGAVVFKIFARTDRIQLLG